VAINTIESLGLDLKKGQNVGPAPELHAIINEKLIAIGQAPVPINEMEADEGMASGMTASPGFTSAPFKTHPSCDQRIQDYLDKALGEGVVELPKKTLIADRFGISRLLSLPMKGDEFASDIIQSYRLRQGVLHNPRHDRRTTKGVFHVAEDGLPIPADKKAVPLSVFGLLMKAAFERMPEQMLELPYTANLPRKSAVWVSSYLRPTVAPEVEGVALAKSMEVRFFAPGGLVANLDFVESVFGNAGDPYAFDAALDVEHWSGQTGCVILAPHLTQMTKKELGLPHFDDASERQRADGMCWKDETEKYNDGGAFKITSRTEDGLIVTVVADNYFGYSKKEIKTQISYACNLGGLSEEEHSGGALTFASYDLGEDFSLGEVMPNEKGYNFSQIKELMAGSIEMHEDGYAIDKRYDNIIYIPQIVRFRLHDQTITWEKPDGKKQVIKLLPYTSYVLPSGYKVEMVKPAGGRRWRLIGTVAEPIFCHKPCTVSGGGKSEISKSIADACLTGPVFVVDFKNDMEQVMMLLDFDYSNIYKNPAGPIDRRAILDPLRTLGSVVRLFTPSEEYTDGYNDFLRSIPPQVLDLLLVVKRFHKPDWPEDWASRFSVDLINGLPGHELKYRNSKLHSTFLRVGYQRDGSWRTFGVRKDFYPAFKLQMEDDITASIVLPARDFKGLGPYDQDKLALKFTANCEYRLFQRPDDAIVRGYDKQTERDMSSVHHFISNYQPLTKAELKQMTQDAIRFDQFTEPMQKLLREHAEDEKGPAYVVSSANPRILSDGSVSKNPRYLQNRTDLLNPRGKYLSEVGIRLARRLKPSAPVYTPVTIVVPGRRNNPPEKGVKPLCVFNPIHNLELPELFMEFISSMTGKSPSTTGAGSEGALTKAPFNALLPIIDLNAAFVSALLTQSPTFVTSAAYVGPFVKVDHDISLLIPEVFSRMTAQERNPKFLIEHGYFERCRDFQHNGEIVRASRLGWRMTNRFERVFFGRVFNSPGAVLTPEMLRPEMQDKDIFAEGVATIVNTHQMVAQNYLKDGSIELAVPPLKQLLYLMATGKTEDGLELEDPALRSMFTIEAMLKSDWYAARLAAQRDVDNKLWGKHLANLDHAIASTIEPEQKELLEGKRLFVQKRLEQIAADDYLDGLVGTIGVNASFYPGK